MGKIICLEISFHFKSCWSTADFICKVAVQMIEEIPVYKCSEILSSREHIDIVVLLLKYILFSCSHY